MGQDYFGNPVSPISESVSAKSREGSMDASSNVHTPSRRQSRGSTAQSITGSNQSRRRSSRTSASKATASSDDLEVVASNADEPGDVDVGDANMDMSMDVGNGGDEDMEVEAEMSPVPIAFVDEEDGEQEGKSDQMVMMEDEDDEEEKKDNKKKGKAPGKLAPRNRRVRFSEVARRTSMLPEDYEFRDGVRVRKSLGPIQHDEGAVRRSTRRRWKPLRRWQGERIRFQRSEEDDLPVPLRAECIGNPDPTPLPRSVLQKLRRGRKTKQESKSEKKSGRRESGEVGEVIERMIGPRGEELDMEEFPEESLPAVRDALLVTSSSSSQPY